MGSNSELSYSLQSGNTNSFSINSKTGTIRSKLLLDRESKDSYTLTVKASDNGSTPLTGITSVDITILDINDNKPTIKNLPLKVTVSEGRSVGHNVFGVNAEDKDLGKWKNHQALSWPLPTVKNLHFHNETNCKTFFYGNKFYFQEIKKAIMIIISMACHLTSLFETETWDLTTWKLFCGKVEAWFILIA